MQNIRISLGSAVSFLVLAGCASMMDGSTEIVHVTTDPINAKCTVTNDEGRVISTFVAPGDFPIVKTHHDLKLLCVKEGVGRAEMILPSGVDRWTYGNIILGGGTALIDWGTGALNQYPRSVALTLSPPEEIVVVEDVLVTRDGEIIIQEDSIIED